MMWKRSMAPRRPVQSLWLLLLAMSASTAALTIAATPLVAQSGDPKEVDIDLDRPVIEAEIVVSSTMPELATASRLSAEELAASQAEDLARHLRDVAGLSAIRRGSINLEPTIRGLQEGQIAMSVDGTRTFAAGPARMDSDLSHVDLHSIGQVRVVKGPYALAWGAGALSAIDLVTHRPHLGSGLDGKIGATFSDNGSRAHGFFNLRYAGDSKWGGLALATRDGDDYEAGGGTAGLVPGDYTSRDSRWRLGIMPRQNLLLDYSGGYQRQTDLDYPGRLLDASYFYTRSHALEARWQTALFDQIYLQLYTNRKDHLMNNDEKPTGRDMPGRMPPLALDISLPTESNTLGGRWRLDLASAEDHDASWSWGGDAYRVEQRAERFVARRSNGAVLFDDVVWPDAETSAVGAWLQRVIALGGARFGATVRLDSVDATAEEPSAFFTANTSVDVDRSDTDVSAAVSATVPMSSRWAAELGVGRVVRTPRTLERYSDRFPSTKFQLAAEFMGNPDLEPETSLEFDAGLRYRTQRTVLSIDGFARRVDDYITVVADPSLPKRLPLSPPTVYRYINGSHATYLGAELALDQRLSTSWSWYLHSDWLRAEDDELEEPVLGIAPWSARIGGRWQVVEDRLGVDAEVLWSDDQDRVASSRFEQPTDGYMVGAVGLDLTLGSWQLDVDISNVSDEAYSHHLDAPNPFTRQRVPARGRSWRFGLQRSF